MATKSDGKGGIAPKFWGKHLRKVWRRYHNKRVRKDGGKKIATELAELESDEDTRTPTMVD
jgi:hypothetical protein